MIDRFYANRYNHKENGNMTSSQDFTKEEIKATFKRKCIYDQK